MFVFIGIEKYYLPPHFVHIGQPMFSEIERNITSQRVKSGMENAKAKGKRIGRPTVTADDIPSVFYKHYPKYQQGQISKKDLSRLCELSYPTVYKYLSIIEEC